MNSSLPQAILVAANHTTPMMQSPGPLWEVQEVFGLYADSYAADELHQLLFVSLWGRDTAIQELLGRLTVSVAEGGLEALTLNREEAGAGTSYDFRDRSRLAKLQGRLPKDNLFGELVHLWLFDPLMQEPDRANRRAYQVSREADEAQLWALTKETCHLPLLDHWREPVLALCKAHGWIQPLTDTHALTVQRLDLGAPELERVIGELIRRGELRADA